MSFIYGQRLIEYAIRIGTDDLMKNPDLVAFQFNADRHLNEGYNLTPPGAKQEVHEPLPFDYFQERLSQIPPTQSETGEIDRFKNPFPTIPDIIAYLNECNFKIIHGFPQGGADLPCISITLGNEHEGKFLGGQQATFESKTAGQSRKMIGTQNDTEYNVSIMSTNFDETELWYFIVKYSIMSYRAVLDGYGLSNIIMNWLDVEPAPDYVASGLFAYQRTCLLSSTKQESILTSAPGYSELVMGVTDMGQPYPQGTGVIVPEDEP